MKSNTYQKFNNLLLRYRYGLFMAYLLKISQSFSVRFKNFKIQNSANVFVFNIIKHLEGIVKIFQKYFSVR
jgi:hypothetical protein